MMSWGHSHEEMVATTIATIIRYRDDDPDVLALSMPCLTCTGGHMIAA